MEMPDLALAEKYLRFVGYYRLSGYWLTFEHSNSSSSGLDRSHRFIQGTSFSQVVDLYVFDRKLRLLCMDAIERIEVAVRTCWAHEVSLATDSHGYLQRDNFTPSWLFDKNLYALIEEVGRSHDQFIRHYQQKYTDPTYPAIWMITEVMSLGSLSKWYKTLASMKLKKRIAHLFHLSAPLLDSILHNLTWVRNVCAHHSRLWDRTLTVGLKAPRCEGLASLLVEDVRHYKLYNSLAVCVYLMNEINPDSQWLNKMQALLQNHSQNLTHMGFPEDWSKRWRQVHGLSWSANIS